jgi:hypothetical protein
MKFSTAAIASSVAALAAAGPVSSRDDSSTPQFWTSKLVTIAPGTDFDNLFLQAANNSLVIGAENQGAACGPDPHNFATFVFGDNQLSLYTANPNQQFYVDASGMGQGIIRYTTGAQPMTRYGSRNNFNVTDSGTLVYRYTPDGEDIGFQACGPAVGAKYTVWLDSVKNPGGYTNCTKFTARVASDWNPVKCQYTQQQ